MNTVSSPAFIWPIVLPSSVLVSLYIGCGCASVPVSVGPSLSLPRRRAGQQDSRCLFMFLVYLSVFDYTEMNLCHYPQLLFYVSVSVSLLFAVPLFLSVPQITCLCAAARVRKLPDTWTAEVG